MMNPLNLPCFECKKPAYFNHHVVPKILGGKNTIPLCIECHSKVHDRKFMSTRELTKIGLQKAKEKGKKLGRPFGAKDGTPRNKENYKKKHKVKSAESQLNEPIFWHT